MSDVARFFAGRSVFITGGTGFVGKQLIEKLLRSCPEVDRIYMLMRPKKGLNLNERIQQTFQCPVNTLAESIKALVDRLFSFSEGCGFDSHYRPGRFRRDLILGLRCRLRTARREIRRCGYC